MSEKLSAPRGTADLFPPESRGWNELESRIAALAARYGYGEIRTPIFEPTELFVRGVGEQTDIVEKEMYTFTDRGDARSRFVPSGRRPSFGPRSNTIFLRPARCASTTSGRFFATSGRRRDAIGSRISSGSNASASPGPRQTWKLFLSHGSSCKVIRSPMRRST